MRHDQKSGDGCHRQCRPAEWQFVMTRLCVLVHLQSLHLAPGDFCLLPRVKMKLLNEFRASRWPHKATKDPQERVLQSCCREWPGLWGKGVRSGGEDLEGLFWVTPVFTGSPGKKGGPLLCPMPSCSRGLLFSLLEQRAF